MLKNDAFKLYILIILLTFTANGDYTKYPKTSDGYLIHNSPYIDNNGTISFSNKTLNNSDFKGEPFYIVEVHPSSNRVNTNDPFFGYQHIHIQHWRYGVC